MRRKQKSISRFPTTLITLLVATIAVVSGQTTCNNGLGRVLYERLPNQQLQGFDDDVVRDTAPPFRVLEKCQDLCLRDRTATNNLVRACTTFDFQPGSRIASFSGNAEYEESTCYLTREQAAPEGIGNLMLVPNSVHFAEICLTSSRPERECPSRRYVFERHPRKKLKLPVSDIKEITAANRSDCEDKCLNEFSFVCRSANFDSTLRSCTLSRFTRRTHPELLEDDPNSDYLENTCLNAERRCDGLAIFVKEENKKLGGPFEVDIFNNMTLEECQAMCMRAEKYFCRSVEFDDQTKQCILSEEDSISQKDDISISSSPSHNFYDLVCLDNQRGSEYPDNSVTSHLFSNGRRPDTAFQRYRNSRLGGEFHSEITGRSLSECLDECLRQTSFQCRSAVYSDRFRTCRLSRYNQRDGMRIIYDADYDYYENLMLGSDDGDRSSTRPVNMHPVTDPWGPQYPDNNRDRFPDDRYPPSRYPPSDGKVPYDRYPGGNVGVNKGGNQNHNVPQEGGERYPMGDRYPTGGTDRYPVGGDRYPGGMGNDRYPASDRYPGVMGDRYPGSSVGDRYPGSNVGSDRYPGTAAGDRYPERMPGDRLPSDMAGGDRYNPNMGYPHNRYPASGGGGNRLPDERYPVTGERYPPAVDSHPAPGQMLPPHTVNERYPPDRYPLDNRIPTSGYPDKRYPDVIDGRYPNDRERYPLARPSPTDSRYPTDTRYPDRGHPDRIYPDRGYPDRRYPDQGYLDRGYPDRGYLDRVQPDRGYPDRMYPDRGYPDRVYPDRVIPNEIYPDTRYPPDRRNPIGDTRFPIKGVPVTGTGLGDTRYPTGSQRPIDSRYPVDGDVAPERYPIDHRYPAPGATRYPVSDNRFPVGNDRYPTNIHKYGNRERFPSGNGYDQFSGSGGTSGFYDRGYERYPGGYSGGYDRGYDRGYGVPARPMISGGYPASGYDNSINQMTGDGFGGYGPVRPYSTRCDVDDTFKQIATRQRLRRQYVRRVVSVPSLTHCQRECTEARDFMCKSFNFRDAALSFDSDREREAANCELSDRDSREIDIQNPTMFDPGAYDFYERSTARSGVDGDCLDVSQTCNEDGMEFTLRTPEGFIGRIYSYGFYDRCFFRGSGGTVNVLRISGPQAYPECGTQRYGDTITNIVVVQFSDNVQTGKDKRFNLTCLFRGPGEAVVTSGYIGAGSGSPIPIEYLPAENTLSSKVRLMILYQGRPTTTIAVGDPLTFRLEAQDGYNHVTDIFATNVVARDPYSGRSVQLIDRYGCPVDPYVFPELDKLREGDMLEARFNAFKIPESNFLVFEATVRTCREGCQPAYCPGQAGRSEPSFGRKRRSINETVLLDEVINSTDVNTNTIITTENMVNINTNLTGLIDDANDIQEHVREMIEVFESRDEIDQDSYAKKIVAPIEAVCLSPSEYHGLISAVVLLIILLLSITLIAGLAYRRYWTVMTKNQSLDRNSPLNSFSPSALHHSISTPNNQFHASGRNTDSSRSNSRPTGLSLFSGSLNKTFATGNLSRMCQIPVMNPIRTNGGNTNDFDDPSEPIYTDPSLFERSRSLRSIAVGNNNEV